MCQRETLGFGLEWGWGWVQVGRTTGQGYNLRGEAVPSINLEEEMTRVPAYKDGWELLMGWR